MHIDRYEVLTQTYGLLADSQELFRRYPAVVYTRPGLPRLLAVPRRAAQARHEQQLLHQHLAPHARPVRVHPLPPPEADRLPPFLVDAQPQHPPAPCPVPAPPEEPCVAPLAVPPHFGCFAACEVPVPPAAAPAVAAVAVPELLEAAAAPEPREAAAAAAPEADPVGLAAQVVLEGIEVACTYPGCAHTVPLYRFAEHAYAHHRAAPQAQLACPICPYASERAATDTLQDNLLMHLSDAHPRYMTPAVAHALQQHVTATLAVHYAQHQVHQVQQEEPQQDQQEQEQQEEQEQVVVAREVPHGDPPLPRAAGAPRAGVRVERVVQAQDSADECIICLMPFAAGDRVAVLECLCRFHERCLDEWLAKRNCCPVHFAHDG